MNSWHLHGKGDSFFEVYQDGREIIYIKTRSDRHRLINNNNYKETKRRSRLTPNKYLKYLKGTEFKPVWNLLT